MPMRTSLSKILACAALCCAAVAAHAQTMRQIPPTAKPGVLTMGVFPEAVLDGKRIRLAMGTTIFDESNRTIVPGSLSGARTVLYEVDPTGNVSRVWLPTAEELAAARQRAGRR